MDQLVKNTGERLGIPLMTWNFWWIIMALFRRKWREILRKLEVWTNGARWKLPLHNRKRKKWEAKQLCFLFLPDTNLSFWRMVCLAVVLKVWSSGHQGQQHLGRLLDTQNLRRHPWPTEAETLGVGPSNLRFGQPSRGRSYMLKFENHGCIVSITHLSPGANIFWNILKQLSFLSNSLESMIAVYWHLSRLSLTKWLSPELCFANIWIRLFLHNFSE